LELWECRDKDKTNDLMQQKGEGRFGLVLGVRNATDNSSYLYMCVKDHFLLLHVLNYVFNSEIERPRVACNLDYGWS
jgi:hypothetical protein